MTHTSLGDEAQARKTGAQPNPDGNPTTNRPPMPEPLEIIFENIPDELTKLDQWVTSHPKWKGTKWDKPPLSVHGSAASSTARVSWTSFETLKKYYPQKTFSYIGFVLTKTAKIVAIDLDGCRNPETGAITPAAQEIIERFASYTEVSPSGEGIRIFILITRWPLDKDGTKVKAPWRRGSEKAEIEFAVSRKYFTVTGHHLDGTPASVQKNQAALEWLIETYFAKSTKPKPTQTTAPISLSLDDEQIIEKARKAANGAKFSAVFDGLNGGNPSSDDEALCCLLAYWTREGAQIERIWRLSPIWRDEKPGKRRHYVECTIKKALETVTATYDPARRITSMMNGSAPKIKASSARDDLTPAQEVETPAATAGEVLPPAARDLVLHCLDCEEAGDAELFAHLYNGRRVLFDHSEKQWYMWGGHHYRSDKTGIIRRLVIAQLATQYLYHAAELTREAEAEGEAGAHKRGQADHLVKRAKQLRKLQRIDNILKLAQSWLGIEGGDWDTRADLLAVENGVVELETGTLRAGQTSDTIRTVAPTKWRGLHEPAPRWEQFTFEIFGGEVELSNFLQRLLGIGLYGAVKEHCLPIFFGVGRNGKDTLLETVNSVLGSCAGAVSSDVLVPDKRPRGGAASPHLCDLQGRRIAWVSETDEGARFSVGQVKYLTGGGSISARPLYGKQYEFAPSHLLLLITNNKPHATAPAGDLFAEYQKWAQKGAMWRNTFGEKMGAKFTKKTIKGRNYYQGIGIVAAAPETTQRERGEV